jgi:integrase
MSTITESAARRLPKVSTKAKALYQIEGHLWLQHIGVSMSFLYMVNAKALQKSRIEVGLGSWQRDGESNLAEGRVTRTWADARTRTVELDRALKEGLHPREVERHLRANLKAAPVIAKATAQVDDTNPRNPPKAKQLTVRQLVIDFVDNSASAQEWISPKTQTDFLAAVTRYVYPIIGDRLVHTITAEDMLKVLTQPKNGTTLWRAITVQAKVTRQRLERMFAYAQRKGYRRTDDESNPASWFHFEHDLPKVSKVHAVKAHPHVKPEAIADVFADLSARTGKSLAARAVLLKMLTVPRTSALIAAKWEEFDLEKATWTIPGARMKGDLKRKQNEFVIPLSTAALDVLRGIPTYHKRTGYLFPAISKANKVQHIGKDSMNSLLRRTGYLGVLSPHGMRHTFSTWRADHTEFASELAEACLAHANGEGNQVAKVYNLGTYLKRRRDVMQAWGEYVTTSQTPANVVDINEKKKRGSKAA